jgi:predicted RNA-binding Zn-ribbon protein involved in translation (DUF1610 family)
MAKKRQEFPAPSRRRVKLERVTPDPKTMSILAPTSKGPALKGTGGLSYLCPGCGEVLLQDVEPGQIRHIVVQCLCGVAGRVTSPDVV